MIGHLELAIERLRHMHGL